MKFKQRGCPRADELSAVANGADAPADVVRHIAKCDTCGQIVENLRRDAHLVEQLRQAKESLLDEDTHRDIIDSCRSAFKADKKE